MLLIIIMILVEKCGFFGPLRSPSKLAAKKWKKNEKNYVYKVEKSTQHITATITSSHNRSHSISKWSKWLTLKTISDMAYNVLRGTLNLQTNQLA